MRLRHCVLSQEPPQSRQDPLGRLLSDEVAAVGELVDLDIGEF